ncbi:unannotated protein [freshwater metagenome]|uniref:Unannotated protein n=1 Tax=freshwater metagenome TaxID=449393 RepID=A0A6J6JP60_9ZZZZ
MKRIPDYFRRLHAPEMSFSISVAILVFGFALVSPAVLIGDGAYYFAVLESLASRGEPSIPNPPGGPETPMVIISGDGKTYAIHFWAYSLLSVPFYLLLDGFGLALGKAFQLLNAALLVLAVHYIFFGSPFRRPAKWLLALGFLSSTGLYYLGWPHPELFSAVALLISAGSLVARKHRLAAFCAAVASLQNPSAVFFILPVLVGALYEHFSKRGGKLPIKKIGFDFFTIGLAASPFCLPYLWSIVKFGTPNPIVANGYIDYGNISVSRLVSLIFDFNQGLIVGMPMVLAIAPFLLLARIRTTVSGRQRFLVRNDLLPLGFLLMAIPVLAQNNFNSDQANFMRYAAWLGVVLLVWVAAEVGRAMEASWPSFVIPALVLQLAVFVWAGGPFVPKHSSYVENKPWVEALWVVNPKLYTPLPEIFYERTLGFELPRTSQLLDSGAAFRGPDGSPLKILTRASNLEEAVGQLCGPQNVDALVDRNLRSGIEFLRAEKGFAYLLGEFTCGGGFPKFFSGTVPGPKDPLFATTAPFGEGWSRLESWGTWSAGHRSEIVFPNSVWRGTKAMTLRGIAFVSEGHSSQSIEVRLNGKIIDRFRVDFPNDSVVREILIPENLSVLGEARISLWLPDAVSPESLGLSSDGRDLAIGIVSLELADEPR